MLEDSNRHLGIEIEALREEVAMLRRMLFGKKSEKMVHEKIGLEEVEQAAVSTPEVPAKEEADKQALPGKKKRRLFATITKEIEHLVIPEDVLKNHWTIPGCRKAAIASRAVRSMYRGISNCTFSACPLSSKKGSEANPARMPPSMPPHRRAFSPVPTWARASSPWPYTTNTASICRSTAR